MCIKKGTSQTMPLISRSHGIAKKPKNKSNNGKIILHKKKILINKKQLTVNDLVNNFVAAKVEPEEIIDNKIQVEKESQVRDGTRAFIAVMLHTLNCRYNFGTSYFTLGLNKLGWHRFILVFDSPLLKSHSWLEIYSTVPDTYSLL